MPLLTADAPLIDADDPAEGFDHSGDDFTAFTPAPTADQNLAAWKAYFRELQEAFPDA